ncbi:MAG: hypothetical protein ACE5IR_06760 [bacterium]
MKGFVYILFGFSTGVLVWLFPIDVLSCPVCFSSASKNVLHTYYISAAFLTLLPFTVLGVIFYWVKSQKRMSHPNSESDEDKEAE